MDKHHPVIPKARSPVIPADTRLVALEAVAGYILDPAQRGMIEADKAVGCRPPCPAALERRRGSRLPLGPDRGTSRRPSVSVHRRFHKVTDRHDRQALRGRDGDRRLLDGHAADTARRRSRFPGLRLSRHGRCRVRGGPCFRGVVAGLGAPFRPEDFRRETRAMVREPPATSMKGSLM